MNIRLGTHLPLVILIALTSCVTRPAPPSPALSEAIRARTGTQFARALYLKPVEANTATLPARLLAPLLIIEVADTNVMPDWPGANQRPQIFFASGSVTLNGSAHEQITYWWTYPKTFSRKRGALPAQGVRITLSSAGRPFIWEVLADTSGASVVFVSQNLEAQALREFGAALPGRRFAVERSLTEAPEVVVARGIEDGPVAMGPIVYLRAGTREVMTVICRCMDAQARELAGQEEYELVYNPNPLRQCLKLPGIQNCLRLPKDF